MAQVNVSVALPQSIIVGDHLKGVKAKVDVTRIPADVIAAIFEGGVKIILTNAYNGGGKDQSETDRKAQLETRLEAWYRGEYRVVARGESQYTAMREQYKQERLEAAGMSGSEVDKAIRATVTRVFGEKEPATFGKFLLAVATEKYNAMPEGEPKDATSATAIADGIEAGLAKRTADAAAARAKLASGLVEVDLGL